jgi:hypothetical protein
VEPANLLKIESLPDGWRDKDDIILHACFQLLKDFVEKEKEVIEQIDWQHDEKTANAKAEINFLYSWWLERFHDEEDFDKINQRYEEDNRMLKRLLMLENISGLNDRIKIKRAAKDFSVSDFNNENWKRATETAIENYWSGKRAEAERHATAKILWSDAALYVRFEAAQNEPLIINDEPNLNEKTRGLWDRDVFEIFVAPDFNQPRKYYEFEVAPTGEWIDLAIEIAPDGKRATDFDYQSEMETAARIETNKILSAMKIEWRAFGKTPKTGDVWKGNLFRCVGSGKTRGYLAWRPTKTEKPNFHVPEAFGEFEFTV